MAFDPITAGIDLAKTVVSTLWPDKSAAEQAQLAGALAMVQGQVDIDKADASSSSPFTSGWRPFIGWTCGVACGWNWIGLPEISREAISVIAGALVAAFFIGQLPGVRDWIKAQWGGAGPQT